MIGRAVLLFALLSLPLLDPSASAQAAPGRGGTPAAAPATPAKPTDAQRRTALENQLKSGQKDQIDQAYASYKAWFAEDPKVGENMFWFARDLFAPLADHTAQTTELMGLARAYKQAHGPYDMGYLNVMEALILFHQGKDADAVAKLQKSLQDEPDATADEMRRALGLVLTPLKKQKQLGDLLNQAIAVGPSDQDVVEGLLKARITALNAAKDYTGALACAKSLFNMCSMAHTSDAITLLDREFLLPNMDDRSKVDQFRNEQTVGATMVMPGQSPHTSAVMQAVKVDASPYAPALAKMTDDSTMKDITRHVILLLVADKGKEAADAAKQALAIAADPKEITTANELLARCYKAQDGTIGRANGWIAANPQAK